MSALITRLTNVSNKLAQNAITVGKPKLQVFLKYAKVEMIPPKPNEIPQIAREASALIKGFKSGAWKHVTVKEALVNTGVFIEVLCWFFVGEVIGRRHLVGYNI